MLEKLEKQVNKIGKTIKRGETIDLIYDGDKIAQYEFTERSIDCKTPLQWLRGCLCFEISLKGLDINKVTLKYNKA